MLTELVALAATDSPEQGNSPLQALPAISHIPARLGGCDLPRHTQSFCARFDLLICVESRAEIRCHPLLLSFVVSPRQEFRS